MGISSWWSASANTPAGRRERRAFGSDDVGVAVGERHRHGLFPIVDHVDVSDRGVEQGFDFVGAAADVLADRAARGIACVANEEARAETCDGADEDCDGIVDEAVPEVGAACQTGALGICAAGTRMMSRSRIMKSACLPTSRDPVSLSMKPE